MKKTDKIAYHQKSLSELNKNLVDISQQLVETKLKLATGQLKDTSQIKKLKYQIALIKTIISQKNEK